MFSSLIPSSTNGLQVQMHLPMTTLHLIKSRQFKILILLKLLQFISLCGHQTTDKNNYWKKRDLCPSSLLRMTHYNAFIALAEFISQSRKNNKKKNTLEGDGSELQDNFASIWELKMKIAMKQRKTSKLKGPLMLFQNRHQKYFKMCMGNNQLNWIA